MLGIEVVVVRWTPVLLGTRLRCMAERMRAGATLYRSWISSASPFAVPLLFPTFPLLSLEQICSNL